MSSDGSTASRKTDEQQGFRHNERGPAAVRGLTPQGSQALEQTSPNAAAVLEDERLVQRILHGDEAAQRLFVERYRQRLLRTCVHFMGYQDPDVEDLVQETFLNAFKALDGWKAQRELYSWLNKICVNLCFKAMRRRRKEQLMAAEGLEAAARSVALEREQQAEQSDAKRSALETVKQALQELDGKCRQIVALRDLDGRSYSDIALALKLAPGTVFSRLARCREALRQLVLGQARQGSGRG